MKGMLVREETVGIGSIKGRLEGIQLNGYKKEKIPQGVGIVG